MMDSLMMILPWVTAFVVGVLGAVFAGMAKFKGKAEGRAEAMLIGPQPFMIELKEQFITRREFDQLASMVALTSSEMKGLFRETMKAVADQNSALDKKITNQNERLTRKIEEVASGAYQSRQKIHMNVNAQGERLAKIEERTEIKGELVAVGEVIAEALATIKKN
jgi:uncharacterized protein YoxC